MLSVCHLVSWVDRLSEIVGKAVSWMCLALILVLLYEIVARYFFVSPTSWAHELSTMLYGTFCVLAGTYTHRYQGHVRSEALYNLFSRRGRAILDVITGLVVLFVLVVFFYASVDFAYESWQNKELSSKSTWAPPIYPFKTVLPVAVGLIALQSLAHLIRDICVALNLPCNACVES
ncbi:C4-dicarboxylate ABC transporter substrate-binding protein [Nitrincola tibetensis]|uniref:TRAP transporter small permease protein n=1 Tax=Nitrincola tibetensis TaxID=2219697 RepID=A0A364NNB8_9GAMM|nr:TRAP transporter small permease subunit [Nitrincola tibetensis]RAU18512.1 C4-dicarboxylate ABC transporter substrate-binding protein [Nitrincola tibetensis]